MTSSTYRNLSVVCQIINMVDFIFFHSVKCYILTANAKLTEQEIREWHTDFLRQYPSGTLNKKTFIDYYQK
ncbi:unnamed protein product [Rotaria sordida]|uniref:Uncharacterized protein n=1 Tax=Rotaria sordida TaxID=392033 RepID=A0A819QS95_9BILA|nr:unnamed protein product [Rotaria sordida]